MSRKARSRPVSGEKGMPPVKPSAAEPSGVVPSTPSILELAKTQPLDVVPFNTHRLDEVREQWAKANWRSLTQIDHEALEAHPDRGRLAIVSAAAALQVGDRRSARERAGRALQWGCERRFLISVLVASARHALGRASVAAGRVEQATRHMQSSLFDVRSQSEARRVAQERADEVNAELTALRELTARQRKFGIKHEQLTPPAWIDELVKRCLAAADVHEGVEAAVDNLLPRPDDRVWFLVRIAEHFLLRNDQMTAVSYLVTAKEWAADANEALRLMLAKQLTYVGQAPVAMDMLIDRAIETVGEKVPEGGLAESIAQSYKAARDSQRSRIEHGHELLLSHLKLHLPRIGAQSSGRRLCMVEIGTTRENVPGQGSTRKLADFCQTEGIHFVTIDMDPHNTRTAQRMFARLSMNFEALTMKGEDYLRTRKEPVDFVFLDAYDFDHGNHSELRQSRYVKYLGSRIDELACHRMHLECAESLVRLLSPVGVICVDDTWIDNGNWTAKGTLAVPFLLEHGFELIDARNRAALLKRLAPRTGGVP